MRGGLRRFRLPPLRSVRVPSFASASDPFRSDVSTGLTVKDCAVILVDGGILCADLGEGPEDGGVDFGGDELCVLVVGRVVGLVVLVEIIELVILAVLVLDCDQGRGILVSRGDLPRIVAPYARFESSSPRFLASYFSAKAALTLNARLSFCSRSESESLPDESTSCAGAIAASLAREVG